MGRRGHLLDRQPSIRAHSVGSYIISSAIPLAVTACCSRLFCIALLSVSWVYFQTLPVLLAMLRIHFSAGFGHDLAWLNLVPGVAVARRGPAKSRPNRYRRMLHRRYLRECQKGGAGVGKTKRGKGSKLMVVADRGGLPNRGNRKKARTQDGRPLRRYRKRWRVERLFAWLQNFRRLITRHEYKRQNWLGFVQLGCIVILMRQSF